MVTKGVVVAQSVLVVQRRTSYRFKMRDDDDDDDDVSNKVFAPFALYVLSTYSAQRELC